MSNDNELRDNLEQFIPRLLGIADRQLTQGLKRKFDADDLVASLCRSVIRREQEGRFAFSDNEELWKLLVIALKRKIYNKVRDESTQKRDYKLEASFDQSTFLAAVSSEPSPEDAIEFEELMARITDQLDETTKKILELKLSGMNNREIAKELDCSERNVGRKLVLLRQVIGEQIVDG